MALSNYLARTVGLRIVDFARKTRTVDIVRELAETECSPLEKLEELQLDKLRRLLMHCQQNVPFYQRQFEEHGLDPSQIRGVSDIKCLPVLTKDAIRANFEELKAANFHDFRPRIKETGGSTGAPLRLYHDERSHGTMWANIYRGFGFGGYTLGDKYLTIASGSLAPKKLRFGMSAYFYLQNSLIVPSYYLEQDYSRHIAELIKKKRPRFIYAYSSTLFALASALKKSGESVSGLQSIFTTADMLYPQQRSLIEEVFGAPVFDNYGCPEAGVMTWECEQHDGYHYNMESCLMETADEDAKGVGRVISTNLTNYAFPIIRYDTGDVARIERSGLCACGRSHNKVKSLLGRQRDILTLSNGRMVHGAFFNHFPSFYANSCIERYQIIQTSLKQLDVHLQLADGCRIDDMSGLEKELKTALDGLVSVRLVEGEFRESALSRKYRTVISDVDNMWTKSDPSS